MKRKRTVNHALTEALRREHGAHLFRGHPVAWHALCPECKGKTIQLRANVVPCGHDDCPDCEPKAST